jgi:hypothetical protein
MGHGKCQLYPADMWRTVRLVPVELPATTAGIFCLSDCVHAILCGVDDSACVFNMLDLSQTFPLIRIFFPACFLGVFFDPH